MKKRLTSWLLVLTMIVSLIPSTLIPTAFAADAAGNGVDINEAMDLEDNKAEITSGGIYTISETRKTALKVNTVAPVVLVLQNVAITTATSPIELTDGAAVTLVVPDGTSNALTCTATAAATDGGKTAGIFVPETATLIIDRAAGGTGTGTLHVTGGYGGAGIGGSRSFGYASNRQAGGNSGGNGGAGQRTIRAQVAGNSGGTGGAGGAGGRDGSSAAAAGTVTINAGIISTTGGVGAAGIGGGRGADGEKASNGVGGKKGGSGKVYTDKGIQFGAAIGAGGWGGSGAGGNGGNGGVGGKGATLKITGGTVTAVGGSGAVGIGGGAGGTGGTGGNGGGSQTDHTRKRQACPFKDGSEASDAFAYSGGCGVSGTGANGYGGYGGNGGDSGSLTIFAGKVTARGTTGYGGGKSGASGSNGSTKYVARARSHGYIDYWNHGTPRKTEWTTDKKLNVESIHGGLLIEATAGGLPGTPGTAKPRGGKPGADGTTAVPNITGSNNNVDFKNNDGATSMGTQPIDSNKNPLYKTVITVKNQETAQLLENAKISIPVTNGDSTYTYDTVTDSMGCGIVWLPVGSYVLKRKMVFKSDVGCMTKEKTLTVTNNNENHIEVGVGIPLTVKTMVDSKVFFDKDTELPMKLLVDGTKIEGSIQGIRWFREKIHNPDGSDNDRLYGTGSVMYSDFQQGYDAAGNDDRSDAVTLTGNNKQAEISVNQNGRYWFEFKVELAGDDGEAATPITLVKLLTVSNIYRKYSIQVKSVELDTKGNTKGNPDYAPLKTALGTNYAGNYGFAWDLNGYQSQTLVKNPSAGFDTVQINGLNSKVKWYNAVFGTQETKMEKNTAKDGFVPVTLKLDQNFLTNNTNADTGADGQPDPTKYTIKYSPEGVPVAEVMIRGVVLNDDQTVKEEKWSFTQSYPEGVTEATITGLKQTGYRIEKVLVNGEEKTLENGNSIHLENLQGTVDKNYSDAVEKVEFVYVDNMTDVTVNAVLNNDHKDDTANATKVAASYTVPAELEKEKTFVPPVVEGYRCVGSNKGDTYKIDSVTAKDSITFYYEKVDGNVTYQAVCEEKNGTKTVLWTDKGTVTKGNAPADKTPNKGVDNYEPDTAVATKYTITGTDTQYPNEDGQYDGVNDITVTYTYKHKTRKVQVQWMNILNSKVVQTDTPVDKNVGEYASISSTVPTGYTVVGSSTATILVDNTDTTQLTATLYCKPSDEATITIQMFSEEEAEKQDGTPFNTVTLTASYDAEQTVTAPTLLGWKLKTGEDDQKKITPTKGQANTVKFVYEKDMETITVNLKVKDGAATTDLPADSKPAGWTGKFKVQKGQRFTIAAPSIVNYKLTADDKIEKTLSAEDIIDGNKSVDFTYEKAEADLITITVKGVKDGNELYSYTKDVKKSADAVAIQVFTLAGYKLDNVKMGQTEVAAQNGTYTINPAGTAQTVTATYSDNMTDVTIHGYLKGTKTSLFNSFTVKAEAGKAFTYAQPSLIGYDTVAPINNTIDVVKTGDSITFYYQKSEGNVTYKAQDEKGKELAVKTVTVAKDGAIVKSTDKANELFTIPYYQVKGEGVVTTIAADKTKYDGVNDVTVTYTYEKIKKTVTIEKIDQATGEKIKGVEDQVTEPLATGETHTVTLSNVDGYTSLDNGSVNIFVKNEDNQVVKVYYKQSAEAFITVKQVCDGVTLNTYQIPAQYGVETTIKAPVMQGYIAPTDTKFTAEKNKTNEVTLNYTLDAWKVTVELVDQTNHEITVPGFKKDYQVKKGDSFSIAAPSINDYSLISNDLVATRTATELEQEAKRTITFKYDKTENVDYVTHTIRGVDKDNNDAELFSYTVLVAKDAADADAVATYYAPTWANLTPATLVQTAKKNETKTVTFEYSSNLATVTVEHVGRNGVKLTEGGITDVKLDGYTVTGKATTIAAPALDDYVCVGAYTDSVQEGKLTQDVPLTAGSNTVKFVYEKIVDSDVVFKLVDKDTNHIINYIKGAIGTTYAPAQPNNALNLSSIHYNFVADKHASDAFKPNGNASVTVSNGMKGVYVVYYERQTRTVTYNFKDVTGGETTETDIKNVTHGNETSARIGEKFKATAPVIDGYTVVGSATFNEVVEAGIDDLVITFNYRQKDSKEVTVNHKVTDTNGEVLFTYTMSASVGEWVTAKSHDFGGKYTLTSNAEQKIRVTNGENTIEFFYAPNFVTVSAFTNTDGQNDQSYGTSITAAKKTGGTVKLNPPSMNGFVLSGIKVDDDGSETTYAQGWDKNTNTLTLTLSEQSKDNIRVTYYYKEIKDVIPDYQANLTIKAQYNGVQLIADRTQVVTKGKDATVIPATRDGYTVKQYKLGENGQLTDVQEAEKLNGITVNVSADTTLIFTYDRTDNTVVLPGKDNIIGGGDDIIVKPGKDNPDQKPETDKNGNIKVPDGGTVILPDGTEVTPPGGSVVKPDGSIVVPGTDGSTDTDKGATEIDPTKPNTLPEGWFMVKYDLMGGKGTVPMQFVKPGETVKALDPVEYGITAPTDRSFKTWNDNVNGNGNDRPVGTMFSNAMVTDIANKTLTLFAQWKNDRPVILSVKDGSKVKQVELNHKNENVLTMYGSYTENEEDKTYTIPVLVDGKPAQDNELRWYVEADSYKKFGFTGGLGSDDIVTVNAQTGEIRVKNSGIVRIYCESVADSSIKLSFVLVVPGDINRDGMVNMDDADLCSEHVLDDVELDDFQKLLGKLNWEYPDTPITMDDVDYIGEIALGDKEI